MTFETPSRAAPPRPPLAGWDEDAAEAAIRMLVHRFYDAIRGDDRLGPVFGARIAPEAWPVHLAKMCDFWSAVLLRTRRYDGRPMAPHVTMDTLEDDDFLRWLALFRATAREVLPPEDADKAIGHAERMADSFRMGIAFHNGRDSARIRPLPRE